MKVIMRLYRQHDLDLIYLYSRSQFSMAKEMKNIIRSEIANTTYHVAAPCESPPDEIELPKQIQFHILLRSGKDDDIIRWILDIARGYRNSALKNVFRQHLSNAVMMPYQKRVKLVFKNTGQKSAQTSLSESLDKTSVADEILSERDGNAAS